MRIVWGVLTLLLSGALLAPWLLPEATILAWAPRCVAQLHGQPPCVLCGMTRAFVALSQGEGQMARQLNGASPWLYGGFAFNSALFGWWLTQRALRR